MSQATSPVDVYTLDFEAIAAAIQAESDAQLREHRQLALVCLNDWMRVRKLIDAELARRTAAAGKAVSA